MPPVSANSSGWRMCWTACSRRARRFITTCGPKDTWYLLTLAQRVSHLLILSTTATRARGSSTTIPMVSINQSKPGISRSIRRKGQRTGLPSLSISRPSGQSMNRSMVAAVSGISATSFLVVMGFTELRLTASSQTTPVPPYLLSPTSRRWRSVFFLNHKGFRQKTSLALGLSETPKPILITSSIVSSVNISGFEQKVKKKLKLLLRQH